MNEKYPKNTMNKQDDLQENIRERMKVPEGYFEANKVRIMQMAAQSEKSPLRLAWRQPLIWLSAAAVLALGLFILPKQFLDTKEPVNLEALPTAAIVNYIDKEYAYSLEENLLADAMGTLPGEEVLWEGLSEDEIIDFLTDSPVEESILYEEYEN